MACDEGLVQRIRERLLDVFGTGELRMFGGVCFTLNGNMACGVVHSDMMVRVGPLRHDQALAQPHAREMDFAGRPMRGYVYVAPEGLADDRPLQGWIDAALDFVWTLPPKRKSPERNSLHRELAGKRSRPKAG
jgi:TfoX/Sxy family transcriptional regulator of competence genes